MKNFTFLAAALLFGFSAAKASAIINLPGENLFAVNIENAEPITFTERGIEFYVFPDGQFDFNTEPSNGEVYYKNGRRSVNATYGAPTHFAEAGVKIEHDNSGKVRRVGNVFINYDAYDRIKRIGSVYMTYNRFALAQVGGLKLIYNNRGEIVDIRGNVKGNNNYEGHYYGSASQYNGSYYGSAQGYNDNDDYYYRKANDGEKKEEKASDKTKR